MCAALYVSFSAIVVSENKNNRWQRVSALLYACHVYTRENQNRKRQKIYTPPAHRIDSYAGRSQAVSLGAARLGRVASGDGAIFETLCLKPRHEGRIEPNSKLAPLLAERFHRFRDIFSRTRAIL